MRNSQYGHSVLTDTQVKILLFVQQYSSRFSKSPLYQEIEDELFLSESTVVKNIKRMAVLGYIERRQRGRIGDMIVRKPIQLGVGGDYVRSV